MSEAQDDKKGNGGYGNKDRPVTIRVNRKEVTLPDDRVTGLQIKRAAKIAENFKLFDPDGDEVPNDKVVRIREGERFTAISGQDVS